MQQSYTSRGAKANTLCDLGDGLEQSAGCVVVISHDRWFPGRMVAHILAVEGPAVVGGDDSAANERLDDTFEDAESLARNRARLNVSVWLRISSLGDRR